MNEAEMELSRRDGGFDRLYFGDNASEPEKCGFLAMTLLFVAFY
jgi:hypothetical protein